MTQKRNDSELELIVIGMRRDGRRRYDVQAKRALVEAVLQPGVRRRTMDVLECSSVRTAAASGWRRHFGLAAVALRTASAAGIGSIACICLTCHFRWNRHLGQATQRRDRDAST